MLAGVPFFGPLPLDRVSQPDKTNKTNMLRLQLLDTLRLFSGEKSIRAGLRVHCRRRRVLPQSDGTSFETRRLRGGDLCFGPAFVGQLAERKCAGLHPPRRADTGTDGPELQKRLSELGSTLPIIFVTGYPDVRATVHAIKAGAEDFLTKPLSSDQLLQAVGRAIAHHNETRGLKSKLDMVRAHIAALTPRERQVFALIIRGNTNKQVARALGGTERTIKAHRHRVMEKMQVQSLAELVSLAERAGVMSGSGHSA